MVVRRLIEMGERKKSDKRKVREHNIKLVLLDWDKAFDKVDQEALFEAMERMGIDDKLIRLTKQLYKKPNVQCRNGTSGTGVEKAEHRH